MCKLISIFFMSVILGLLLFIFKIDVTKFELSCLLTIVFTVLAVNVASIAHIHLVLNSLEERAKKICFDGVRKELKENIILCFTASFVALCMFLLSKISNLIYESEVIIISIFLFSFILIMFALYELVVEVIFALKPIVKNKEVEEDI